MSYKMVVRVMGTEGQMMGWTEFQANARGDGKLWAEAAVVVPITVAGVISRYSVHWTDINTEIQLKPKDENPITLKGGENVAVFPASWPVITVGPAAGGLPPVTVGRNVTISVPTGSLTAVGYAG